MCILLRAENTVRNIEFPVQPEAENKGSYLGPSIFPRVSKVELRGCERHTCQDPCEFSETGTWLGMADGLLGGEHL